MSQGNGRFCHPPMGQIEVISGPMFSAKTEELIRRLVKCLIAKQHVQVFKPRIDNRDDGVFKKDHISSRSGYSQPATLIKHSSELLDLADAGVEVIGVDEAQFLDNDLAINCDKLANKGIRVIVAGLDTDYLGNPFGPLPGLLCRAEVVDKMWAVCVRCSQPASKTYRKVACADYLVVGDSDIYEARCRSCWEVPPEPPPSS